MKLAHTDDIRVQGASSTSGATSLGGGFTGFSQQGSGFSVTSTAAPAGELSFSFSGLLRYKQCASNRDHRFCAEMNQSSFCKLIVVWVLRWCFKWLSVLCPHTLCYTF